MPVASLNITPRDPLANVCFLSYNLCFALMRVLVAEGGMLPAGDKTMIPLNWRLKLPPGHVGLQYL